MGSPGLGSSEFGQALRRCGDIRDLFFNEYKNAGRQLTTFKDELDSINKLLTSQFELRRRTGRELPGLLRLQETLEECWTYLDKHRNTLRRYPELGAREKLDKALKTLVFNVDRDLESYRARLMHHRSDIMIFMVHHLVERDLDRVDAGPSTFPGHHPTETSLNTLSPLDKKLANLTSAVYTYRRLKIGNSVSLAAPGHDRERQSELKREIEKSVLDLCEEVDLPPFQLSALSLRLDREQPVKERWQGVLESTPLPTTFRGNATARYTEGMKEVYQRARDVNAGAIIEIEGHNPIQASGYRIFGRCCYWTNEAEIVLEHHLPDSSRKGCPYSKHRMYNKPYSLSFLADQDLIIRDPEHGYKEQRSGLRPQYHFGDEPAMRQFQADLRRKDFLGEYHVASISAKNSIQKTKECINLWQGREGRRDITMSFSLRLSSAMETYELPMRWFHRPQAEGSATTIKLDLVRDSTSVTHPPDSRRTSRVPSFSLSRNKPFRSSMETLASVNTIGTIQSMSGAETAPAEWIKRLEFLKLEFEKPAEAQSFLAQAFDFAPGMSTRTPSLITAPTPRTVSPDLSPYIQRRDTGTSPSSPARIANMPSGEMGRPFIPHAPGPGSINLGDPYGTLAGDDDFWRTGPDNKGETPTGLLNRNAREHQYG